MNPNIPNNGSLPPVRPATTTNAPGGGSNAEQQVHYPANGATWHLSVHGSLVRQNNHRYGIAIGSQLVPFSGNWQQTLAQAGYASLPVPTPAIVYYHRDSVPQTRVVLTHFRQAQLSLDTSTFESQPYVRSQSGSFERFLMQQPNVRIVSGLPPGPDQTGGGGTAGASGAAAPSSTGGQLPGHTTVTLQLQRLSMQDSQGTQAMSASSTTVSLLQRRQRSASPSQSSQPSTQRRRLHSPPAGSSAVASTSAAASGSAAPANPGFMTAQQYRQSMPIDPSNRNRSRICGLIAIGTFVGVPLPLERAQQYLTGRPDDGLTSDESARILQNHFRVPTTSLNFYGFHNAAWVRQQLHVFVQQGGFDRVLVHHHWAHVNRDYVVTARAHQFTVMQVNGQWWCYDANPQNPSPLPYRVPDLAVFLAQSFEEGPERQRGLELLTSNGLPPAFTNNLQRYQADAQRMLPFQYSPGVMNAELRAIIGPMVALRARLLTQLAQEIEPVNPALANAIRQVNPAIDIDYNLVLAVVAFAELSADEQNAVRSMQDAESSVFVRVVLDQLHAVTRRPTVRAIAQAWNRQALDFEAWHDAVGYWTALLAQPVPTPEPIQNGAEFFRAELLGLEHQAPSMDMVIDRQILQDAAVLMNLLGEQVSFRLPAPREGQSRAARLTQTLSNDYGMEPRTISFTDMQLMREHANGVTEDRGIALMHRTENGVTTESSLQFRREIGSIWRVHVPETETHEGAWVRIQGRLGDYLFSRLNQVQLAGPVEILWLDGGIPRTGNTVVGTLMRRMIVAMGLFDDSSTDGSNFGDDQYVADIGVVMDDRIRNDDDDDNVSLTGSIGSRVSVPDVFNNNDDSVQYSAESDTDIGLGTENDDDSDNVSLSGSIGSGASVPDVFSNNDDDLQYSGESDSVSLTSSARRRTSVTGSQSGSDNMSLSDSVDSTAGVSNAGSAGATRAAAYTPDLAIESNTRRWTRLRDRFTSMNVPPTGRRYRVLEAAGEFLEFMEINAQPVAPDSEETTSDIEVLVNDEDAFRQAWDMQAEYLNVLRADGEDAAGDLIWNQAMLGLWNPAIANVSDIPVRHESLARAYIRELRERAPSLVMFDFALSAASALIALIPEGDPVAYLSDLTPDQRQALEPGVSGIPSLTEQRNYLRFVNDFINFIVDQTPPFSQSGSSSDRPHIMLFADSRGLMAAFRRQLRTRIDSDRRISPITRTGIMTQVRAFGTWISTEQVQPGETMHMMATRYLAVTFPDEADRASGQRDRRRYVTMEATLFSRLLPFLNTHYGNHNACTVPLSQPVQRPVVQRTRWPVTDAMRQFANDNNFMTALQNEVTHFSGLGETRANLMLRRIDHFGHWLHTTAPIQQGETLRQMAGRYMEVTYPNEAALPPELRSSMYSPTSTAIFRHLLPFINSYLDGANVSTVPPQPANDGNSAASGGSVRPSGSAVGEESASYTVNNNVSDVQYDADIGMDTDVRIRNDNEDNDNVSLSGSNESQAGGVDASNNNDDSVQYIAERHNDVGPGTRNDDVHDNVSLTGSVSRRTSNAGSTGPTNWPPYIPNFNEEGNGRRWMALHDRFMSMDFPPTRARYRVLEAASGFLHFLESHPQPVSRGSAETTRDVEVLVTDGDAFNLAWETQAQMMHITMPNEPNRLRAIAGLRDPAGIPSFGTPARHDALVREYEQALRGRAQSLHVLEFAFAAVFPLISIIPGNNPSTYIRNLTPAERQELVERRLQRMSRNVSAIRRRAQNPSGGARNRRAERREGQIDRYRQFANDFINYVVNQTQPFSQPQTQQRVRPQNSFPPTVAMMQFITNDTFMAALEGHMRANPNLVSNSRRTMLSLIRGFGSWLTNVQAQPGDTMEQIARRYMDRTFPGDAALPPANRDPSYGNTQTTIFTHFLPFMRSYFNNANASTVPQQPTNHSTEEAEQG